MTKRGQSPNCQPSGQCSARGAVAMAARLVPIVAHPAPRVRTRRCCDAANVDYQMPTTLQNSAGVMTMADLG